MQHELNAPALGTRDTSSGSNRSGTTGALSTIATRVPEKLYYGERIRGAARVTVNLYGNNQPLAPRLDLCNHSPTGFEWGYGGSGPAQLALALLADHLGDQDAEALTLYQDFKREIVSLLGPEWCITSSMIDLWLRLYRERHGLRPEQGITGGVVYR